MPVRAKLTGVKSLAFEQRARKNKFKIRQQFCGIWKSKTWLRSITIQYTHRTLTPVDKPEDWFFEYDCV